MARYCLVLLFLCNIAFAEELNVILQQFNIVENVVKEAKSKGYSDDEAKWAVQSNTFEVDTGMLCSYLPKLDECK